MVDVKIKILIGLIFALFIFLYLKSAPVVQGAGEYSLPDDNADCPQNCREIPWLAGADVWNGNGTPGGGSLPNYTSVTCNGLTEGSSESTDNTTVINNCLNTISSGQAALIPPGIYYVNGTISVPSNKALRGSGSTNCSQGTWLSATFRGDTGAGATCTTIDFGTSGTVRSAGSRTVGTPVNLTSGYTKGSTTITTASSPQVSAGNYIIVDELEDPSIPSTITGEDGPCNWCGEQSGTDRPMTQIVQVAAVSGSGPYTISLARPLYYTFNASSTPRLAKLTMSGVKIGIENIKLDGEVAHTTRTSPHIGMTGCVDCWIKSVETYHTPAVKKAYPTYLQYTYALEIRDSYFHFGDTNASDMDYAIGFFGPNSDAKIENNIMRENRHGFSQEGGGSGNVFLYNYVDDQFTDDLTYLASPRTNHGAHPYMDLWEGNVISHCCGDGFWGSSSHNVFFRNWLWGDETGNFPGYDSTHPNYGFIGIDLPKLNVYYSFVGNVIGNPNLHTIWSNAVLFSGNCSWNGTRATPVVYGIGCRSSTGGTYDPNIRATTILHGNYDYKTQGVAYWDGGSNHTLAASMYYTAKPSFIGSCTYPAFGPDVSGITNLIPAQTRYAGSSCGSNPTPIVGDINLDHIVNAIDYSILNSHWFTNDSSSDLNHDGIVNAIDYSLLNSNWFKTW